MGNPAKAATQEVADDDIEEVAEGESPEAEIDEDSEEGQALAFRNAVNSAVKAMTVDVKGNVSFPKGTPVEVREAAMLEKRRRDTQSSYTKTAQENKRLKKEKDVLLTKVKGAVNVQLPEAEAQALEDLKFSDPEAWRKRINQLEREARRKQDEQLDKELTQISSSELDKDEIEERRQTLVEFQKAHPGFRLDDDVIASDIPPRLTKRLETGEISFDVFLQECYDYLNTGKVVKQDKLRKQPNLGKVAGGSSPGKNDRNVDMVTSYKKEVF